MLLHSKPIKRVIMIVCTIIMIFSLPSTAFALGTSRYIELTNRENLERDTTKISEEWAEHDTMQLNQKEYLARWEKVSKEVTIDENTIIQDTCELFISTIYAERRNKEYDCMEFTVPIRYNEQQNATLMYLESQNQYQREISELCGFDIVGDNISFEGFHAQIFGDVCNARVQLHYSYELKGEFEDTFFLNCEYYLTLNRVEGKWRVASVRTSLPNEQTVDFSYGAFDAHAAAVAVFKEYDLSETVTDEMEGVGFVEPNGEAYSYKTTPYNTVTAVNYAKKYFDQTNQMFGASGANCQNFASQCVWAGLRVGCGGAGTSTTDFPAVSTAWAGSNAANVWCRNQYTTRYGSSYWLNWGWDNVNGFLKIILLSDHTQSGPQGYYWRGISKAAVGDVIYWDTSNSHSINNGDYEHAMFVTQATGTSGSRGIGNLCIAANTEATTSAYMPLAQYCSYPASWFATAHITGGYYWVSNY